MPPPNGVSIDHRNHRLGQRTDLFVQIQHVQSGYTIFSDVTAAAFDILIATTAKCFVASSGEDNDADVIAITTNAHGIQHFNVGFRAEGIVYLRTIDCDFSDVIAPFKSNVLVRLNCGPSSLTHIRVGCVT